MAELNTDKADRRVWLLRVPPYLAERWKAACRQDADGADVDDMAEGGGSLGTITVSDLPDGTSQTVLEVPESMVEGAMPRRYTLQPARRFPDMSVMSSEADGGASGGVSGPGAAAEAAVPFLKRPRLDGVVAHKFDAVPSQAPQEAGKGAIDETYRAMMRRRTVASLQKGRSVAIIEDPVAAKKLLKAQNNATSLYVKQTQADREQVQARSAREALARPAPNRRVKLDRPDLEQALFALFERQQHWAFAALQKELGQPAGWLREVLAELASQVKRGPHKDMWELQQQYKVAGAGAAGLGGGGVEGAA